MLTHPRNLFTLTQLRNYESGSVYWLKIQLKLVKCKIRINIELPELMMTTSK